MATRVMTADEFELAEAIAEALAGGDPIEGGELLAGFGEVTAPRLLRGAVRVAAKAIVGGEAGEYEVEIVVRQKS